MINYRTLKRLAKASKASVKELLALAPQNDPFYRNLAKKASALKREDEFATIF